MRSRSLRDARRAGLKTTICHAKEPSDRANVRLCSGRPHLALLRQRQAGREDGDTATGGRRRECGRGGRAGRARSPEGLPEATRRAAAHTHTHTHIHTYVQTQRRTDDQAGPNLRA